MMSGKEYLDFVDSLQGAITPGDNSAITALLKQRVTSSNKNYLPRPVLVLTFKSGLFQFDKNDLQRVFSQVCDLMALGLIDGGRGAVIICSTFADSIKAIRKVNGRKIERQGSLDHLCLNFMPDNQKSIDTIKSVTIASRNAQAEKASAIQAEETMGQILSSNKEITSVSEHSRQPSTAPTQSQSSSAPKITCKYEIDAFDDEAAKAFLLAKRIIGPKGSNMKKIIEECFDDGTFEPDALKLRLRGKGSGFKEGPHNRGSTIINDRMQRATSPLH